MEICLNGYFNPRSHKGSDVDLTLSQAFFEVFQSTLPQGERRRWVCNTSPYLLISIHAPTRGATAVTETVSRILRISIHAPTRGATGPDGSIQPQKQNFNPRSHKGSDSLNSVEPLPYTNFNPRSHKGSDEYELGPGTMNVIFQSTLPQGERHPSLQKSLNSATFQSTLPQGERPYSGI